MAVTKVGGITNLLINGVQYPLRGNITITLNNVKREAVVGNDQFHGIKEMPEEASIEVEITDYAGLDANTVANLVDVTVTAQCNNGKTAVLYNATQINNLAVDAIEGKFTAKFVGPNGKWITS